MPDSERVRAAILYWDGIDCLIGYVILILSYEEFLFFFLQKPDCLLNIVWYVLQ
jgi:hypothetical protein